MFTQPAAAVNAAGLVGLGREQAKMRSNWIPQRHNIGEKPINERGTLRRVPHWCNGRSLERGWVSHGRGGAVVAVG